MATTQKSKSTTYRNTPAWWQAFNAAVGAAKTPESRAALQVVRHLAWKTPTGHVGWDKGTTPAVVSNAPVFGAKTGDVLHEAMERVQSRLPKHPTTTALVKATTAMKPKA